MIGEVVQKDKVKTSRRRPRNRLQDSILASVTLLLLSTLWLIVSRSSGFDDRVPFVLLTLSIIVIVIQYALLRSRVTVLKPEALPPECVGHLEKWKESGTLTTVVANLTRGQVWKLSEVIVRMFGEVVLTRGTGEKVKLSRVGMKVEPFGEKDGQRFSRVILYRIDLAAERGLRKPWRTVPREQAYAVQPLVELPGWME